MADEGNPIEVAPSQVRGLKHREQSGKFCLALGRTFTGAGIETGSLPPPALAIEVAPSQVRGLKPLKYLAKSLEAIVAPSQVRGLKQRSFNLLWRQRSRTFTGAGIETANLVAANNVAVSRTFTGAGIETSFQTS